jgi:uncharacterized membrane protein (DUF4010 family)
MDYILLQKFLIAICIGAIIGTVKEKEKSIRRNFGGFRTFILVALTGAFSYFLTDLTKIEWLFPVIFFAIVIMTGLSYVFMAKTGRIGIKTELAIFLTYILGYVAMTEYATVAILLSAVIVVIIESDKFVHKFIANTNLEEWMATLRFGAVALIVYPILPNSYIDPFEIINPSKIWLLVVLISGVNFIGYFLIKTVGSKRGLILDGIVGGLVSSTATTLSLSSQSRVLKSLDGPLTLSTSISSIIMFLRVLILLLVISAELFLTSLPYILPLIVIMGLSTLYICNDVIKNYRKTDASKIEIEEESPFSFSPAFKLAMIFTIIQIASKLTLNYIGNQGIYLVSLISGLVDVDPIVISLGELFNSKGIDGITAVVAVIVAVTINNGLKGLIAYFNGSQKYGIKILKIFGITFFAGVLMVGLILLFNLKTALQ